MVEKNTSHSSTNPAWAPSAVAVISSPAPTTEAETISPGPKNDEEARQPTGGSCTASASRAYGSPRTNLSGGVCALSEAGVDAVIDDSRRRWGRNGAPGRDLA